MFIRFDQHTAASNAQAESQGTSGISALQSHLDQTLRKLHQDFGETGKLLKQDAEHRETITALREQLKASQLRSDSASSQLNAARKTEANLKKANTALESQLSVPKSNSTPVHEAQVQLSEAKTELGNIKQALQTAETSLASKSEELSALTPVNTQLVERSQTLQVQLEELQMKATGLERDCEELRRQGHNNEQHVRKEMREHVEKVELQLKAETKNELKKLQSERNRLNEQVRSLQDDLDSANNRLTRAQLDQSQEVLSKQELDRAKKHTDSQKQEIESLKASLAKLQTALKGGDGVKEQYAAVSAQLAAERSKAEAALAETAELKAKCAQGDVILKASEKNATEAIEDAQRTKAGLEHYKASCKQAIDDAASKADRNAEAQQKALSEGQAELEAVKAGAAKFRTEVETSWKQEQEFNAKRITELRHKQDETERQRDEAQSNVKQLQSGTNAIEAERSAFNEQLSEMQRRAELAEANLKNVQSSTELLSEMQRRAEAAEASLKEIQVSSTTRHGVVTCPGQDGITPTTTARASELTRPRKVLDRNTGLVSEVGRVPTPELLRPDSRRTASSSSIHGAHRLLTKETAALNSHPSGDMYNTRSSLSPGVDPILKIRSEEFPALPSVVEEAQLDRVSKFRGDRLPYPPAVVEETQFDDGSKFKYPRLPAVVGETQFDSSVPYPAGNARLRAFSPMIAISSQGGNAHGHRASNNFTIYEDSQDLGRPLQSSDLKDHGQLQDTLSWNQAEKDKYTFQKPVAHPNSASKRVHAPVKASSNVRRSASYGSKSDASGGVHRAGTPHNQNMLSRQNSNLSSSPHFVRDSQGARRQNTYQSFGSSAGKRKPSRTGSNGIADPRLVGRGPAVPTQKRKPESQVIENSAPLTKKRVLGMPSLEVYGRPAHSSSSYLPSMSLGSHGSSQYGSNNGTGSIHVRNLGGTSARQPRPDKKTSKSKYCPRT